MHLGILSDTHGQLARTVRAVTTLINQGAEALVHCGDLTGPEIVHACCTAGRPCWFVLGNCDYDEPGLRAAIDATGSVCLGYGGIIELGGRRVAVTHGDRPEEVRRLVAERPDYLLSGHSHRRADHRDGPTRHINPGALHRATPWTVALLDLAADDLRFLEIP
jgi:putative phosphoesterase